MPWPGASPARPGPRPPSPSTTTKSAAGRRGRGAGSHPDHPSARPLSALPRGPRNVKTQHSRQDPALRVP